MKIVHLTKRPLSPKAEELVRFDMESIGQVIAAMHGERPEVWLADPDQYEKDGRVLRDSTSPRLLAYSPGAAILYVTDGCNSCSHALDVVLGSMTEAQLENLAAKTGIRPELLRELSAHSSG
ncbi:MAG TPA: hypothetical protein VFR18_27865 [Terriglobia bacterium]|nr:hypothetical protein [Terriglobia bacterium]